MKTLILILYTIVIIATGLPLIKSTAWWIRIFDFPRIQIAALILLAIILAYVYLDFKWVYKLPLLLILVVTLVYQLQFVVVYTPLCKTQAKDSNSPVAENSFFLLVSNVRMENDDKEGVYERVKKYNPDVLLINEADQDWAASLSKLDEDFPYSIKYPLDHIFYSGEFGLLSLKKLEDIGSDHFPLLIGLNYESDDNNTEGLEKTNADEKAEVEEKIEEGKKNSSKK